MAHWRSKVMSAAEWPDFQNQYETLFISQGGDEGMALFMRDGPGGDGEQIMLIPGHRSELVERLSPGEWGDRQNPQEVNWILLVGSSDAAQRFGLTLGAH